MVTNFSEEHIEVDKIDYTLFLNRKGIVSWENITKASKKAVEMQEKYKNTNDILKNDNEDPIEVEDNANPFDYSSDSELDDIEKDEALLKEIYIKFYWIALYTNHKLSISQVTEWFNKAEEEYGIEQLVQLANKMVEDANVNKYGNKELKKLAALNQAK